MESGFGVHWICYPHVRKRVRAGGNVVLEVHITAIAS